MPTKRTLDFIEEVKERFNDWIVVNEEEQIVEVIPTGSLSLDISTGIGGIPLGKFIEIFGIESSGKTTLALSISKNAMRLGKRVLYLDAETTLDFSYVNAVIGEYDKSLFKLIQPETMEQTLQIAELGIKRKDFDVIILDSIGSMSPEKVQTDDLNDANVALLSRIMTKFVQRNAANVKESKVAFVGINQVRDKIGSYVGGLETPGGHAWKHILSLKIQLARAEDIKIERDGKEEVIGISTRFTIKKNKLAPPLKTFFIPIIFGEGIDTYRDIVQFAEVIGVLSKAGPYYKLGEDTIGQGLVKTIEQLKENKELLDKITTMCYNTIRKE